MLSPLQNWTTPIPFLLGLSAADVNRLQRIQNRAKLVFKAKKRDHVSPYLKQELHWLPIKARIENVFTCLQMFH